jgi:hypothetical protein
MNDEQHESGPGWSRLCWGALAVMLYVLSIGPAAWLERKTHNEYLGKVMEPMYTPLIVLADQPP